MPKTCDNKSVGAIIRSGGSYLVIKRKNYPVAYASVAGHLDGETYEQALLKEVREEVGLTVAEFGKRLSAQFKNPCKREGGSWHKWQVYEVLSFEGTPQAASDAGEAFFVSIDELSCLAERTRSFEKKLSIPARDIPRFTAAVSDDAEWQKNPGLEPVWLLIFGELGVV